MYDLGEHAEHGRELADSYLADLYGQGAPDIPTYVLSSRDFHRKFQQDLLDLAPVEVGLYKPHRELLRGIRKGVYLEDLDDHNERCVPRYQKMREDHAKSSDPWDQQLVANIDRQLAFWGAATPEVVTVHEYAHAFLDAYTGNPTWKDDLTSEGFATFTELAVLEGSEYFDPAYVRVYEDARLPALAPAQQEGLAMFRRLWEQSPSTDFFTASVRRLGERKGWFSRVWIADYMKVLDEISSEELATSSDLCELVLSRR